MKPKSNSKSKKRNRVISQQAIQLIGEKISGDVEHNFQNPRHKNKHSANFDNFMSLGSHYGSNRQPIQPAFEISRKSKVMVSKGSKISATKPELLKDEKLENNYLIISNNEAPRTKIPMIDDPTKSSNSQNGHSPMLTKRKSSQRRTSHLPRRHTTKRLIEKSNKVGLNPHLSKHSKENRSETRNTER